ncbi:hypothetical protein BHE74_00035763 [Ensete ventricosum]|nr:hypothetical protein BHE74_00035763 [Ensete ventricosum]
MDSVSPVTLDLNKEKGHCSNSAVVFDTSFLRRQAKIPESFVWPLSERPHPLEELEVPVVDLRGLFDGDETSISHAADAVRSACVRHGFFQVINHKVDAKVSSDALDAAGDFFKLPQSTKLRARRQPGSAWGYVGAHADRFASKLPWKETLTFGYDYSERRDGVLDYFTSKLGEGFEPMGYDASLTLSRGRIPIERERFVKQEGVPEVLRGHEGAVAVGHGAAGDQSGRGTGVLQAVLRGRELHHEVQQLPAVPRARAGAGDGASLRSHRADDSAARPSRRPAGVHGGQMAGRSPRPARAGHQHRRHALSNGRYKSCLHRAVVNSERERLSLAFFVCPRGDRVVRPPRELLLLEEEEEAVPRAFPDFTWAELLEFTQTHYRADTTTLQSFARRRFLASSP